MALRNLIVLVLVLVACSRTETPAGIFTPLQEGPKDLYVVASDFTTGAVYRVDLAAGRVSETVLPAHGDASARFSSSLGNLVVVNRLAGNHLTLAEADLTRVMGQIALPPASNPQDVLPIDSGEAWISYFKSPRVERRDLKSGQIRAEVDLTEWADADGYPEASYWFTTPGTAWVALQRIDNLTFVSAGEGYVIPIRLSDNRVERDRVVKIEKGNPFTEIKAVGDRLCVGAAGVLDRRTPRLDGAIECWSPDGGPVETLVSEATLHGEILDFEALPSGTGLAITGNPRTDLVFFDAAGVRTLAEGQGYQFSHILADPERRVWYVADRAPENPVIRVLDWNGTERARIPLALPPFRLVLRER